MIYTSSCCNHCDCLCVIIIIIIIIIIFTIIIIIIIININIIINIINVHCACIYVHMTSMYQLNLSETHSSVSLYSGWDLSEFDIIAHIPIKASNDFYTLGDVIANGQSLHGEHISLQAVVRTVSKKLLTNPLLMY